MLCWSASDTEHEQNLCVRHGTVFRGQPDKQGHGPCIVLSPYVQNCMVPTVSNATYAQYNSGPIVATLLPLWLCQALTSALSATSTV